MRFDHIGIVAATLSTGRAHLQSLLDIERWTQEFTDPVNGVYVQFGRDNSDICYELVAPCGESSPITKMLSSGRNILTMSPIWCPIWIGHRINYVRAAACRPDRRSLLLLTTANASSFF